MIEILQDRYAPQNHCFGCGPANEQGLRIKSFVEGDEVVCHWHAQRHHEAWPGMLNGGIVGTLFDCHSNWTAAWHLMGRQGRDTPPSTVTAEFHVKLLYPTATDDVIVLRAKVAESSDRKAVIEATMETKGRPTATCRGVFVAVEPGHPAYHRW